jgi:hypothetical protein
MWYAMTSTSMKVTITQFRKDIVCDFPFTRIASVALDEKWTRDPFDRLIVSNAKANAFSALVSADEEIGRNYPKTIW